MGTCCLPLPPGIFFYVPNESALIRICFNRFTESARCCRRALARSLVLSPRPNLAEPRFTSAEPNYSPTAPRSTRSIRITSGDSPSSAAASVIGVSKGSTQTRRDETRARKRKREERRKRARERENGSRGVGEKGREGERYRTVLSRCGIRYGTGRVIRQPGPLVRLRAAKLTRSSVYTLIATPRLRNPLRRHRVTGHRADPALRCGLFVSAEFSPRRQSSRKRSRSPSDTSRPQ